MENKGKSKKFVGSLGGKSTENAGEASAGAANSTDMVGNTSIAFVSKAAAAAGVKDKYGLTKAVEPVVGCRGLGKKDMVHNDAMPRIAVDAETFEVTADGETLTCEPAQSLPLAQTFFLF